jgi:hypothetical protein
MKRKQPMVLTSQKSDGVAPDHKAKEAKKKKQVEEPATRTGLVKEHDEEKKKKKKDEKKKAGTTLREKTVVKKSRVPRVLKIHSSNDEDEDKNLGPKDTPQPEEAEKLVEEDQNKAVEEGGTSIPQGTLPQQVPLVEDQVGIDEGQKDNVQSDSPNAEPNVPVAEGGEYAPKHPEVEGKEVNTVYFPYLNFFQLLIYLIVFSF